MVTVSTNALITPSASPPTSRGFPSPEKRQRIAYTPSPLSDLDIHNARRASSLRVLDVWANLAQRYNHRPNEDDIVDILTGEVVKDRGVLRSSFQQYDIGCFADADLAAGNDASSDGAAEEDDELDSFAEQADISGGLEQRERLYWNVPPVQLMNPADAADLREFLEAEKQRRDLWGGEEEMSSTSDDQEARNREDWQEGEDEGEVEEVEEEEEENFDKLEGGDVSCDDKLPANDTSDHATKEHTDNLPKPTDEESDDELGTWGLVEGNTIYQVSRNDTMDDDDDIIEIFELSSPIKSRDKSKHMPHKTSPSSRSISISKPQASFHPATSLLRQTPTKKSQSFPPSTQLQTPPLSSCCVIDTPHISSPPLDPLPLSYSPLPSLPPSSSPPSSPTKPRPKARPPWKPLDPISTVASPLSSSPIRRMDLAKVHGKSNLMVNSTLKPSPSQSQSQVSRSHLPNRSKSFKPHLQPEVLIEMRPGRGKTPAPVVSIPPEVETAEDVGYGSFPSFELDFERDEDVGGENEQEIIPAKNKGKSREIEPDIESDSEDPIIISSPQARPHISGTSTVPHTQAKIKKLFSDSEDMSAPISMHTRSRKRKRVLSENFSGDGSVDNNIVGCEDKASSSRGSSPEKPPCENQRHFRSRSHAPYSSSQMQVREQSDHPYSHLQSRTTPPRSHQKSRSQHRHRHTHFDPNANIQYPTVPNPFAPIQDPRAQFIISQAMHQLSSLMTGGAPNLSQPQQYPWPHQQLPPTYPATSYQPYHNPHWTSYTPSHYHTYPGPSTPSSSSQQRTRASSSTFVTPTHPHPYPYTPSLSGGTLPHSSPEPPSSSPLRDLVPETRTKSLVRRSKSRGRRVSFTIDHERSVSGDTSRSRSVSMADMREWEVETNDSPVSRNRRSQSANVNVQTKMDSSAIVRGRSKSTKRDGSPYPRPVSQSTPQVSGKGKAGVEVQEDVGDELDISSNESPTDMRGQTPGPPSRRPSGQKRPGSRRLRT